MATLPSPSPRQACRRATATGLAAAATGLLLAACQPRPGSNQVQQLQQRQEQLELKLQQLEQKLNAVTPRDGADRSGKPPAGPVKSLTYRTTNQGNRLRIYWADGSSTDLECNQEQSTLACG